MGSKSRNSKSPERERELLERSIVALRKLLHAAQPESVAEDVPMTLGQDADFVLSFGSTDRPLRLVGEVKTVAPPRAVRDAVHRIRATAARVSNSAIPILIAPYLSPAVREICRDSGVAYLDLEGNAFLRARGLLIDREVASKPAPQRRELKSLFRPKTARILRLLLRDPARAWRVLDLAREAAVSLGQVSAARKRLLDHERAKIEENGIRLSNPEALVDDWRANYEPPISKREVFYTTLHGQSLDDALRSILGCDEKHGRAILGSFSAARWLAPFARTSTLTLYADTRGRERLKSNLELSSPAKGENVIILEPKDDGIFLDAISPEANIVCTSAVQTYLDLSIAGERGREAADHLRRERLRFPS